MAMNRAAMKRQKELERHRRKKEKAARREQRKLEKEERAAERPVDPNVDPDIAHIVPGPQPRHDDWGLPVEPADAKD